MFIDARDTFENCYSADVAIVGAGATGITIAHELGRAGHSVILIESGGQQISSASQSLNRTQLHGLRSFSGPASRFRCFGGSTARWGGQCRPLDEVDFATNYNQSKYGWPFGLKEMLPYYRRAAAICNLPKDFNETPWLSAADDGGLDKIMYLFAHPRDFGEKYRSEFNESPNIRVLLNATITHIQLDRNGNRVSHLSACVSNGNETRVLADSVVLAGGGIENARILLASNDIAQNGIGNENDIVGRYFIDHPYAFIGELRAPEADRVINELTIHDYDDVGVHQKSHLALTLNDTRIVNENLNKCALYLVRRPLYKTMAEYYSSAGISFNYIVDLLRSREALDRPLLPEITESTKGISSILATAGRAARHLVWPTHTFAARVVLTSKPQANSRVTLSNENDRFGVPIPRINWQLHQSDKEGLKTLIASAKEYFVSHQLGKLSEIPWDEKTGWPRGMTGGKHHMGTTRMNSDPNHGVVNSDCRLHSVNNLYVSGSSVFPTGGYANPTLTIVALAVRLADYLREV